MSTYSEISAAQFENVNSLRSYPFEDGGALASRDGKVLPHDVIVDMHVVVPASFRKMSGSDGAQGVTMPVVRMKSVHMSQSMVSACFVSSDGNKKDAVSVTVSRGNFVPYMPYRLEKLAGSSNIGGIVTFGNFEFPGRPETYFLDAKVHPCCVSALNPPGLTRFVDLRSGDSVSGDAEMSFSGYIGSRMDGKSFELSLESGAAEDLVSDCVKSAGADACGATPISSINGVRPDEDGNIVLWFH